MRGFSTATFLQPLWNSTAISSATPTATYWAALTELVKQISTTSGFNLEGAFRPFPVEVAVEFQSGSRKTPGPLDTYYQLDLNDVCHSRIHLQAIILDFGKFVADLIEKARKIKMI